MHYTKLVRNNEYGQGLDSSIELFKDVSMSQNMAYGQGLMTKRSFNSLKNLIAGSGVKRLTQGMLLESAYKSEQSGANSADLSVLLANSFISGIKSKQISFDYLNQEYQNVKDFLSLETSISKEDLFKSIYSATSNQRLSSMIVEALELSGVEGKLYPIHTRSTTYSVELISGFNFEISSYPEFYVNAGKWEAENVKIFIVDGVIERESEIYKILHSCIAEGQAIVFIARGYGEEVIATIGANVERGIIKCLPIRIPYELESVNFITDIAVCSNSDIVTPLKGDMVVTKEYKNIATVDNVVSRLGHLTIINKNINIGGHLRQLREKKDHQDIEKVSDILDKRIQNLSARSVYLRIASKTEQERQYEFECVDYGLRTAKSALEYGIINIQELCRKFDSLKPINHITEERPRKSILSAFYHALSITKTLCSISQAIVIDL